jgi:hypothetical protein
MKDQVGEFDVDIEFIRRSLGTSTKGGTGQGRTSTSRSKGIYSYS